MVASTLPVVRVLEHLFSCLYTASDGKEVLALMEAIGKVSAEFPSEYLAVIVPFMVSVEPSADSRKWIKFMSHFSHIDSRLIFFGDQRAATPTVAIDTILSVSVTSLYSVDVNLRRASLIPLKCLALTQLETCIDRLRESMKLYRINYEFFDFVKFVITHCTDDRVSAVKIVPSILVMLKSILLEESTVDVILADDLIVSIANCVSLVCGRVLSILSTHADIEWVHQLATTITPTLVSVYEVMFPLCWSKDLLAKKCGVYEVVKATVSLVALLKFIGDLCTYNRRPSGTSSPIAMNAASYMFSAQNVSSIVRPVQSAVVRMIVHAKTAPQLVASVDSVRILMGAKFLVHDEETTGVVMQILIDLGVSLGPLSFWSSNLGIVQQSVNYLVRQVSEPGLIFLIDKCFGGSRNNVADKLVVMHYIKQGLGNRSVGIGHKKPYFVQLIGGIEKMCDQRMTFSDESICSSYALIQLINQCLQTGVGGKSVVASHASIIDYLLRFVILSDQKATITPTALRSNWLLPAASASSVGEGPSLRDVRALALETTLNCAAAQSNAPILKDKLLHCLSQLPEHGMDVLVRALSLCHVGPITSDLPPKTFAWIVLNEQVISANTWENLLKNTVPIVGPTVTEWSVLERIMMNGTTRSSDTTKALNNQYVDQFAAALLGHDLLSKQIRKSFRPSLELFTKASFPNKAEILITWIEQQVGAASDSGATTTPFVDDSNRTSVLLQSPDMYATVACLGSLIASVMLPEHEFSEYVHVASRVSEIFASKMKNRSNGFLASWLWNIAKGSNTGDANAEGAVSAALRYSLGFSCEYASGQFVPSVVPVLRRMYLEPCWITLKSYVGQKEGASNIPSPETMLLATLSTVERIYTSLINHKVMSMSEDVSGISNEIFSLVLAQVGQDAAVHEFSLVCATAIGAGTALALTKNLVALSQPNFSNGISTAVDCLLSGVEGRGFTTISESYSTQKIHAISDFLSAIILQTHSASAQWLGISGLGQSFSQKSADSQNPLVRLLCIDVLHRVTKAVMSKKQGDIRSAAEWLETFVIALPRTRDPVTAEIATEFVHYLMELQGGSTVLFTPSSVQFFVSYFRSVKIVPNDLVPGLCLLLLHASQDAVHASSAFCLDLLIALIGDRGSVVFDSEETATEESSLDKIMIYSYSRKNPLLVPKFAAVIHAIAAVNDKCFETVVKYLLNSPSNPITPLVTTSISKDKKIFVKLINSCCDFMNNSASGGVSAAKILADAISVEDSRIAHTMGKYSSALIGTALMFVANISRECSNESETASALVNALLKDNSSVRGDVIVQSAVGRSKQEQIQFMVSYYLSRNLSSAKSLTEFFLPYLDRATAAGSGAAGKNILRNQQFAAIIALAQILSMCGEIDNDQLSAQVRDKLLSILESGETDEAKIMAIISSFHKMVSFKFALFNDNVLSGVLNVYQRSQANEVLLECTKILVIACNKVAIVEGNKEWQSKLISAVPDILTTISSKINAPETPHLELELFANTMQLCGWICQVIAFSEAETTISFKETMAPILFAEVYVRRHIDGESANKVLDAIREVRSNSAASFAISPKVYLTMAKKYFEQNTILFSDISPSRSPGVVNEVAMLGTKTANSASPADKMEILKLLVNFTKIHKKGPFVNQARAFVLGHLGDINW